MIRRTLEAIKSDVQSFLNLKDPDNLATCSVVLSNLLNQEGKLEFSESNGDSTDHYLVMTLVNVAQETHLKPPARPREIADDKLGMENPEININLFVLFTAHSSQYETALDILSNVIGFFQSKSYFDSGNTPSLPSNVERVAVDIQSLTFEQSNYLWGLMGAKYMPSVLYKLRTLSISERQLSDIGSPITKIHFQE